MTRLVAVPFLLAALPVIGQETPASKKDEITQGFRAVVVSEPRFKDPKDIRNPVPAKDKVGRGPVDLVTEHGLNPTIAVFSRVIPADASHPLAAVVKKIDELCEVKDYKARRLGAYLVFLALQDEFRIDPTFDAKRDQVAQFAAGAKSTQTTIALAEAKEANGVPTQVTAMGVGAEDDFVIVLYHKLNVVKRWKFKAATPPTADDLKALEDEVAKLLGSAKK